MSQASRSVTLQATLVGSANNPLPNKSIAFEYELQGASSFTSAGSATTNASGLASVIVSLSVPNTYNFQANFAGDASYDAASGAVNGFRVTDKTTVSLVVTPQ